MAFRGQGFQLHDPVAQRALIEIGQFTRDIRHIAGQHNSGSDYLSRIPKVNVDTPIDLQGTAYQEVNVDALEGYKIQSVDPKLIAEAQDLCPEITKIKAGYHSNSVIFGPVKFGETVLHCELSQSRPRPVLPKELRIFITKQMHDMRHPGIRETIRLISTHYYWNSMREEITRFCQTCHGCQSEKPSKHPKPHIGHFEMPDQRFMHIHLDLVGPLPPSEGNKYILTIKDRSTRLLRALPLVDPTAKAIADNFLLHWASLFGLPSLVTSDRGSAFTSALWTEVQQGLGAEIKYSPIYHPETNGFTYVNKKSPIFVLS